MDKSETTSKDIETAEALFDRRLAAVSEAVDSHHAYLLEYLHRMTRQYQDAENLLQDLWRHVLLHFDEAHIQCLPLLRRKAYQLFVDHYRKKTRRGEVVLDEVPELPARTVDFSAATEDEEQALKIRFWNEYPTVDLTEQQKDILWLSARYGFTYKEIEEKTGIASSTVGDWIALGRRKLADAINTEAAK